MLLALYFMSLIVEYSELYVQLVQNQKTKTEADGLAFLSHQIAKQ